MENFTEIVDLLAVHACLLHSFVHLLHPRSFHMLRLVSGIYPLLSVNLTSVSVSVTQLLFPRLSHPLSLLVAIYNTLTLSLSAACAD